LLQKIGLLNALLIPLDTLLKLLSGISATKKKDERKAEAREAKLKRMAQGIEKQTTYGWPN